MYYATTSSDDSVYIFGGRTGAFPWNSAIIAKYNDGSWYNIGQLAQARAGFSAMTLGTNTIIIGGFPANRDNNYYLSET